MGRRDLRRSEISGAHLQGTLLCEKTAVEAKNIDISQISVTNICALWASSKIYF